MATTINGSAGVITNSGAVYDGLQSGTAVSASGTSVDFTSIPAWVKRVTVMFNGVSTNGTSIPVIQLGDSGGVETTGYSGGSVQLAGGTNVLSGNSTGFKLQGSAAATNFMHGIAIISLLDASLNLWVMQATVAINDGGAVDSSGGSKTISATLDRIRITTANGTDTFDAGSINIMYE